MGATKAVEEEIEETEIIMVEACMLRLLLRIMIMGAMEVVVTMTDTTIHLTSQCTIDKIILPQEIIPLGVVAEIIGHITGKIEKNCT